MEPADLETKLAAIADFASQRQIGPVVEAQRAAGCQEYLLRSTWTPYQPSRYRERFAEPAAGGAAFARDCSQAAELLAAWEPHAWAPLVAALRRSVERPVLIIGEGSSRLFPAAFACALAAHIAPAIRLGVSGGRDAEALDLRARSCVLVSNSGRTRELVELGPRFAGGEQPLALLGVAGGPLAALAREARALLARPEEAVAATASVFAQALALAHAVSEAAGAEPPWQALRAAVSAAAQARLPARAHAVSRVWWCGSESGPSGELALKTMETAGCAGIHAPGTMVLHGIEEVLDTGDLVVVFAPDARDRERMRERIGATGAWLLEISSAGDIHLPDIGPWSALPQLVAGWALLAQLAARLGRDPDRPEARAQGRQRGHRARRGGLTPASSALGGGSGRAAAARRRRRNRAARPPPRRRPAGWARRPSRSSPGRTSSPRWRRTRPARPPPSTGTARAGSARDRASRAPPRRRDGRPGWRSPWRAAPGPCSAAPASPP